MGAVRDGKEVPLDVLDTMGSRASGKTTHMCPTLWTLLCDYCDPDDFAFVGFRNMQDDANNLFEDIVNTLDAYDYKYTAIPSRKKITYKKNTLRVYGLNNGRKSTGAKKAGLPRLGGVKYAFIFFEERYEFTQKDISWIKQSMRGMKTQTQFIYISACNPWSKQNEYINELLSIQPFDINIAKDNGSQLGLYTTKRSIDVGGGQTQEIIERRLIHYTNWRVTKEFLSPQQINTIMDSYKVSKVIGATVDLGVPGYETGAIYTDNMHKIGKATYIEHEFLLAGLDYGWGRDKGSGKTVALFMGASMNEGVDIYGEYTHSNADVVKDVNLVAKEVVEFYIHQMNAYIKHIGWTAPFPLTVRVDNSAVGIITILNDTARAYRVNWLRFVGCKKYPVNDRIEITISLLARSKFRIAENVPIYPVKTLKTEMEFARYEETSTQKREKIDDHALNAFEYGLETVMYKFAQDHEIYLNRKLSKKVW